MIVPTALLGVGLMWFAVAGVVFIAAVLVVLGTRQGRWQRDADTDPPGFTADPGD